MIHAVYDKYKQEVLWERRHLHVSNNKSKPNITEILCNEQIMSRETYSSQILMAKIYINESG